MGFFENMLESFSAKDLKSRIVYVVIAGILVCILSAAALYLLLTSVQRISVEGVARWAADSKDQLAISIDASDLGKLANREGIAVELLDPPSGKITVECAIDSLDPTPPTVNLSCADNPSNLRGREKIEATIVLFEDPLWRMLWGNR